MPIKLQIDHPDRMVVGIAEGKITAQDLDRFLGEIGAAGAFHYRKIVDVAAGALALDDREMAAFSERVLGALPKERTGPIAIVSRDTQRELAGLFAKLTGDTRPAQVFRSIHDARRWLQENSRKA